MKGPALLLSLALFTGHTANFADAQRRTAEIPSGRIVDLSYHLTLKPSIGPQPRGFISKRILRALPTRVTTIRPTGIPPPNMVELTSMPLSILPKGETVSMKFRSNNLWGQV